MNKTIIYFLIFLLSFSTALAVSITTDKVGYDSGNIVQITPAECQGNYILQVRDKDFNLIDIIPGQNNAATTYNTQSSGATGAYTISLSCTNGDATKTFCLDDAACVAQQSAPAPAAPSGGGGGCIPQWKCSQWSLCNASLQQSRTCTESACRQKPKVEVQNCSKCQESWICGQWSACSAGKQSRTCVDEHNCNTFAQKPELQRACQAAAAPAQQQLQQQPKQLQQQQPKAVQPQVQKPAALSTVLAALKKAWVSKKTYIVAFPSLLLIILVIFFVAHFKHQQPKVVYDPEELRKWINAEKDSGTSNDDIINILADHVGWSRQKILQTFPVALQQKIEAGMEGKAVSG